MVTDAEKRALTAYLEGLRALPRRPRAMLVVSAHWEEPVPTVMTRPRPPMLYDYYGFPPETYRIPGPRPGEPSWRRGCARCSGRPASRPPRTARAASTTARSCR